MLRCSPVRIESAERVVMCVEHRCPRLFNCCFPVDQVIDACRRHAAAPPKLADGAVDRAAPGVVMLTGARVGIGTNGDETQLARTPARCRARPPAARLAVRPGLDLIADRNSADDALGNIVHDALDLRARRESNLSEKLPAFDPGAGDAADDAFDSVLPAPVQHMRASEGVEVDGLCRHGEHFIVGLPARIDAANRSPGRHDGGDGAAFAVPARRPRCGVPVFQGVGVAGVQCHRVHSYAASDGLLSETIFSQDRGERQLRFPHRPPTGLARDRR